MSALHLGRIWAASPISPNIDPGAAKYNLGHVAEIPAFQVLNYINNRHDTNIVALAERGVFEWGSEITYSMSALAWDEADGFIYISNTASPDPTTRPGLNPAQWGKSAVQITQAQYNAAVAAWNNHMANTSNPHQLTVDILNTYSKTVIDSKVGGVQLDITNHENNHENPHNTTAVQAGAVPVVGGSYTGLVKHLFASTGIGDASLAASLLADTTGAFLALGASSKLGLDNTNTAVFINSSAVKSPLLIASAYIAAREAIEANYVPPTPDCEVQFRNTINITNGSGAVTFTGPAATRGYLDKSATAQTAALNTPRYTAKGMYLDGLTDGESCSLPSTNNLTFTEFTYCLDFVPTPTSLLVGTYTSGGQNAGVVCNASNITAISVVGGMAVAQLLGANDGLRHKVTVTSSATTKTTNFYLDGVLKTTVPGKQDMPSGNIVMALAGNASYKTTYVNSYRTWLSALTAQQISNL